MTRLPRGRWAEVSGLVWLRWKSSVGNSGRKVAATAAVWAIVSFAAVYVGVVSGEADGTAVVSGALLAWMLTPLIGAGGTEVAAAARLAPWPTTEAGRAAASWLSAFFDIPVVVLGPSVWAVFAAKGGLLGAAVGLCVTAASVTVGQVGAATVETVRHRKPRRTMLWGAAAAGVGVVVVAARTMGGPDVLQLGGLAVGATATWQGCGVVMAACALVVAAAWKTFLVGGGQNRKPFVDGRIGWPSFSGPIVGWWPELSAATKVTGRAATTKLIVAGAWAAPLLLAVAGSVGGRISSTELAAAVVVAAAGACCANMFSYSGSGAVLMLAGPHHRWRWVCAHGVVSAAVLTVAGAGAVVVAFAAGVAAGSPVGGIVGLLVAVPLAVAAGLSRSLRRPSEGDHDSVRARPAPPRDTAALSASLAGALLAVEVTAQFNWVGGAVVWLSFLLWWVARAALAAANPKTYPKIAEAVAN